MALALMGHALEVSGRVAIGFPIPAFGEIEWRPSMHPVSPNRGFGKTIESKPGSGCCVGEFQRSEKRLGRRDSSGRAARCLNLGEEKQGFGCGW